MIVKDEKDVHFVSTRYKEIKNKLLNKYSQCETKFAELLIDSGFYFIREKCDYKIGNRWSYYDFFIPSLRLYIEIDGEEHSEPKQQMIDAQKKRQVVAHLNRLIRYTNKEVLEISGVSLDDFFDEYDETATITKPDPICFYLQITNYVETQVYYTITLNQPSNKLEYSFAYEIIDNSSEELNNQTSAPANGWWWIGATEASNPTFHNNEDIRPGNNPSNILTATDGTDCKIVDLPEEVDTTLKTVMLVVKVSVKDDENSLLGEDFSFTVTATTSKLNS